MSIMSFNTDHIDKKLDNLTLDSSSNSNNSSNNVQASVSSQNPVSAAQTTAEWFSFDGQYIPPQPQRFKQPKKSLLSSSLAGERNHSSSSGLSQPITVNYNATSNHVNQDRSAYFSFDESADVTSADSTAIEIPSGRYTDEHPEPELLASSVGKEIDGRLIPSSSAISLLSLNSHQLPSMHPNPIYHSYSTELPEKVVSPKFPQSAQLQNHNQNSPQIQNVTAFTDRKNSFTNIRSRNSITHLSQQRLQPYQRFTSPPPVLQQQSSASLAQQLHQPQPQNGFSTDFSMSHATAQSIPIASGNKTEPDSPNLDPVSIGGSPSHFWLSSQTPPRSLASSYNRNSRTHLYQMQNQQQPQANQHQQQQHQHQSQHQYPQSHQSQSHQPLSQPSQQPMYIPLNNINNYTTATPKQVHQGDNSPVIEPVQTPSEEMPMTPLFLNKLSGSTATTAHHSDSYFGEFASSNIEGRAVSIIDEKESEDEDEDDESYKRNEDYEMNS